MARRSSPPAWRGALTSAVLFEAVVGVGAAQAGSPRIAGLRLAGDATPVAAGDAFHRGRGLLALGDVPAALAAFQAALRAAPQSTAALNGIGVCYDRFGRYDISRSYYEAALAIDPESPAVLNNFGYSLYLQGDIDAAVPRLIAARDGADPEVAAASARTLALIAARTHNAEPETGTVEIEAAPVAARIERTSGSEVRLVLGDQPLRVAFREARPANTARAVPSSRPPAPHDDRATAVATVETFRPVPPAPAGLRSARLETPPPSLALRSSPPAVAAIASPDVAAAGNRLLVGHPGAAVADVAIDPASARREPVASAPRDGLPVDPPRRPRPLAAMPLMVHFAPAAGPQPPGAWGLATLPAAPAPLPMAGDGHRLPARPPGMIPPAPATTDAAVPPDAGAFGRFADRLRGWSAVIAAGSDGGCGDDRRFDRFAERLRRWQADAGDMATARRDAA